MTKMECRFCKAKATAIKTEAVRTLAEDGGPDILTPEDFPICEGCADYWYDGTEEYPGVKAP